MQDLCLNNLRKYGGLSLVSQLAESLSRKDLESLLEIVNIALQVNSKEELVKLWPKVADFAELEGAIFGISKHQSAGSIVQFDSITFGIDPEWAGKYQDGQGVHQDPIILAAIKSETPLSWDVAAKLALDIDPEAFEKSVFRQHALASGMDYGCIYCRRSNYIGQVVSVTAVTTGKNPITEAQRTRINILLPHLNEILVRQGFVSTPEISERETEVLKWAAAGKSNWELSKILNISERTVKFHLRNIYRKLDVQNRSQAVAQAMRSGLIDR